MTVLIVDDEDINIDILKEWLEFLGHEAIPARSGEEALEIYGEKGKEIQLVILDVIMPGIGGEGVFLKLKEMNPDVRVIIISGYASEDKVIELLKAGAFSFIQKPFKMETLEEKMREAIEG